MKILVTGAAGFIGSHLVDALILLGHKVQVIDDLSTGLKENLNPKAEFTKWDISEIWGKTDADYIFHLAALPSVPFSVSHPTKTHRVNVEGTYNVLKMALDTNTEFKGNVKKVIFASSSSVYGQNNLPFIEDLDNLKPESPYALHKLIGEQYCRLFDKLYGLPTLCLRFFNVYGSRSRPDSDYSLVISKFKKLKKEGRPLPIYGNGEQSRDFVYVDDVVNALILAMVTPVHNEVINICGGKSITINQLADLIGGKKEYLPERKGDLKHTLGDNTKAKNLLS
jgi:UDP-glucose 4-epimerase